MDILDKTLISFLLQIVIQLAAHILEKYYHSHVISKMYVSEEDFWDSKVSVKTTFDSFFFYFQRSSPQNQGF